MLKKVLKSFCQGEDLKNTRRNILNTIIVQSLLFRVEILCEKEAKGQGGNLAR